MGSRFEGYSPLLGIEMGNFIICISLVAELCTGLDVVCQDVL